MKPRSLIVDDEKNIRRMLTIILEGAGHQVRAAASGEEALTQLAQEPADLVLLDVRLPGIDGVETLRQIRAAGTASAMVMISGQPTVALAVEATRLGAHDFLEKPLSKERVLLAARNALQASQLSAEVQRYRHHEARRQRMVGDSEAMVGLGQQITKVGPTGATVLIRGESGSGKELVARALHEASPRAGAAFIKVNCAAIPEELIESELFGCVRGAYTGADRTREGKFLAADGGTLFLDEVGDMSLRVQAKVLRALQEGEIERVGDPQIRSVDVRVLAATNKNLPAEIEAGRFREDLYFRLNVIPVLVPPLRERRGDIPKLANHFLALFAAENDLPPKTLDAEAVDLLRRRSWRGNVRELQNVIERLAILSGGPQILGSDVFSLAPAEDAGARPPAGPAPAPADPAQALGPITSLDDVRRAGGLVAARRMCEEFWIETCLDETGGNVSEAARCLGIDRTTLHKKMQALGLIGRPPRGGQRPEAKGAAS